VPAGGIAAAFRNVPALTAAAIFCGVLSWTGANPVAPLPFVLLVAAYWATGRTVLAGAAIAGAVLIGGFVTLRAQAGLFYGLFVLAGVVLGAGIRRQHTFGAVVSRVTAWTCAVFAGFVAFHMTWSVWEQQAAASYDAVLAQTRDAGGDAAGQEAALDLLRWMLVEHWADVSAGLMFGSFLVCAALATGATAFWVRLRHDLPGPRTGFETMRPPDWLVWPAILCAVAWFVEQRAPNGVTRAIAWNAAIGLAAIYWLNGLSLVVYAVRHLRPHAFVVIALVVFMIYAGGWMLSFAGLFDTWWEFRVKVDRLVAAREKLREGRGGDE